MHATMRHRRFDIDKCRAENNLNGKRKPRPNGVLATVYKLIFDCNQIAASCAKFLYRLSLFLSLCVLAILVLPSLPSCNLTDAWVSGYLGADPPDIQVEKSWIHSGEGFEAKLVCIVYADPVATVCWLFECTVPFVPLCPDSFCYFSWIFRLLRLRGHGQAVSSRPPHRPRLMQELCFQVTFSSFSCFSCFSFIQLFGSVVFCCAVFSCLFLTGFVPLWPAIPFSDVLLWQINAIFICPTFISFRFSFRFELWQEEVTASGSNFELNLLVAIVVALN